MDAERLMLETDASGHLKQMPKLPPNKKLEAIFLIVENVSEGPVLDQLCPPTEGSLVKPTAEEIMGMAREFAQLPELDRRDADEILGYDDDGLPRS